MDRQGKRNKIMSFLTHYHCFADHFEIYVSTLIHNKWNQV